MICLLLISSIVDIVVCQSGIIILVRFRETFELNQLKSTLHNFYWFFQDLTGCKLVVINLDRPISYIFFQVPANFFFIVKNLGIDK